MVGRGGPLNSSLCSGRSASPAFDDDDGTSFASSRCAAWPDATRVWVGAALACGARFIPCKARSHSEKSTGPGAQMYTCAVCATSLLFSCKVMDMLWPFLQITQATVGSATTRASAIGIARWGACRPRGRRLFSNTSKVWRAGRLRTPCAATDRPGYCT